MSDVHRVQSDPGKPGKPRKSAIFKKTHGKPGKFSKKFLRIRGLRENSRNFFLESLIFFYVDKIHLYLKYVLPVRSL